MFDFIAKLYGPFFDLNNWQTVITSGNDWLLILSLVIIEILLSVDNAVVLAAQTQVLPTKKLQEESLFYGLLGAYIFRFIVIGLGVYLIHFWEIKVIGAAYLMYLVYQYFFKKDNKKSKMHLKSAKERGTRKFFWMVVLQIEFMDIIFSVDSVLSALAISHNPVIVLLGGMIGILAIRGIAEFIMILMKKVPELKTMAYVLIAFISLKLFLSIPMIHIEIPPTIFGTFVLLSIVVTIVIHYLRKRKQNGN